jgi:hypothetical protein
MRSYNYVTVRDFELTIVEYYVILVKLPYELQVR